MHSHMILNNNVFCSMMPLMTNHSTLEYTDIQATIHVWFHRPAGTTGGIIVTVVGGRGGGELTLAA